MQLLTKDSIMKNFIALLLALAVFAGTAAVATVHHQVITCASSDC
jgi:hypothetical protein